jgi:SAM-dependent methyltransferase
MTDSGVDAGFEQWTVFARLRAGNRMHHREAYATLAQVLADWHCRPALQVLDIGCGDAHEISQVLREVSVAEYTGIDNQPDMIEQARANLAALPARLRLINADYLEALDLVAGPFHLVWLGLFLHHLPTPQKRSFFRRAIRLLAAGGLLLSHDPMLREGETQRDFLRRITRASQENWHELSEAERTALSHHWSLHGHQEQFSELDAMAREAGFSKAATLWRDPEDFFAVAAFHALDLE